MERVGASSQKTFIKKKLSSVGERIRRMKQQQKKVLIDETACCNEWGSGTADVPAGTTDSDIREHFSSSYPVCLKECKGTSGKKDVLLGG